VPGPVPLLYAADHALHAPINEFDQGRLVPYHESPERIEGVYRHLAAQGMGKPVRLNRKALVEDLLMVHDVEMLDQIRAAASAQGEDQYLYPEFFPIRLSMANLPKSLAGRMGEFCSDPYSPVGPGTWHAALSAAGLALEGAEILLRGEAPCVYALCRPPGHHAGPDFFGSYCYLNNAALGAHRLLSLGRVAILDVDYHHGNGTQQIFWDEARVLFASLHIDPNVDFPYFSGYAHETGGPLAPGSTYNIPLPPGTDSVSYLNGLDAILAAIRAFQPAALVVSLGYDAYHEDPFSAFRVDTAVYTAMGSRVGSLGLPTLLVQEGGYAVHMLPRLAENFLEGYLVTRPWDR
jgi:acetoin utilization deacetylase AcuC-like enzyme